MIVAHAIGSSNAATMRTVNINMLPRRLRTSSPRLMIIAAHTQTTQFSSSRFLRNNRSEKKQPQQQQPSIPTLRPRVVSKPSPSSAPQPLSSADTRSLLAYISQGANDENTTVNPVDSTRPAPLNLPTKPSLSSDGSGGSGSFSLKYYLALGKAYTTFYKTGVKNVWTNYQTLRFSQLAHPSLLPLLPPEPISAQSRSQALAQEQSERDTKDVKTETAGPMGPGWMRAARAVHMAGLTELTRSELQLVRRAKRDVRRVIPFVGVLLVLGELTPFVVAMGLLTPPGTCVLPTQREKERVKMAGVKEEAARRLGFGEGEGVVNMVMPPERVVETVFGLSEEEVTAVGMLFGLGRLKVLGGRGREALVDYFRYLLLDDGLILKGGGVGKMVREEVEMAVWERGGFEVGLGLEPEEAEMDQRWWLERWVEGSSRAML